MQFYDRKYENKTYINCRPKKAIVCIVYHNDQRSKTRTTDVKGSHVIFALQPEAVSKVITARTDKCPGF